MEVTLRKIGDTLVCGDKVMTVSLVTDSKPYIGGGGGRCMTRWATLFEVGSAKPPLDLVFWKHTIDRNESGISFSKRHG